MLRLPRRFRRPRAELRVGLSEPTPPDEYSCGVARLQATLLPLEPFRVRCGRLELALLTTLFSRTALDGYHEHSSERVYQTVLLCKDYQARKDESLLFHADLRLPDAPHHESRPARRQWQARARIEIYGYRELWATRVLCDVSPPKGGAPTVDGSGFLPLYEFGGNRPD